VLVEDCHSHDHTGLSLHPGSGSQRTIIRRNRMVGNEQGLFFCWGVRWGLAEKNYIDGNKLYGISIRHHDTGTIVRDNEVRASGEVGILFRDETGPGFEGNRNLIEKNRIIGLAQESGIGVDSRGQTKLLTIAQNEMEKPRRRASAWVFGSEPRRLRLPWRKTALKGFSQPVLDLRRKSPLQS
jgi:hypothetical protein